MTNQRVCLNFHTSALEFADQTRRGVGISIYYTFFDRNQKKLLSCSTLVHASHRGELALHPYHRSVSPPRGLMVRASAVDASAIGVEMVSKVCKDGAKVHVLAIPYHSSLISSQCILFVWSVVKCQLCLMCESDVSFALIAF